MEKELRGAKIEKTKGRDAKLFILEV